MTPYRAPVGVAHRILAAFGITQATPAYERWVKPDGFDLVDFRDVLWESPCIIGVDWRASLDDGLWAVARSLGHLGITAQYEADPESDSGTFAIEPGGRVAVSYGPGDDNFDHVIRAVHGITPAEIAFRMWPYNDGCDSWSYAVLREGDWAELDATAPWVMGQLFVPMGPAPSRPGSPQSHRPAPGGRGFLARLIPPLGPRRN